MRLRMTDDTTAGLAGYWPSGSCASLCAWDDRNTTSGYSAADAGPYPLDLAFAPAP